MDANDLTAIIAEHLRGLDTIVTVAAANEDDPTLLEVTTQGGTVSYVAVGDD